MQCDPTVAYCGPTALGGPDVCNQKKPEGADCADSRECYFGWSCRLGVCKDPVELGENEACGGTDPCDHSTYCDPSTMLCTKLRRQAESCDTAEACEAGLGCVGLVLEPAPGTSGINGVCAPWIVAGGTCTSAAAGTVTGCPALGAECDNGVCTNISGGVGLDGDCSSADCAAGLGCSAVKRCDHLLAIFGDCGGDKSSLCEPGLTCAQDASAQYNRPGTCLPANVLACFLPSDS